MVAYPGGRKRKHPPKQSNKREHIEKLLDQQQTY